MDGRRPTTHAHPLLRSAFSNWLALGATLGASLFITPFLVGALGAFEYGLLLLAMGVTDYFGLLDLGMRGTLQRFVARLSGTRDRRALNAVFTAALGVTLAIALVVCLLTVVLAALLPDFFKLGGGDRFAFQAFLVLLGLGATVMFPAYLLGNVLCGLGRFDMNNAVYVVSLVFRTALVVTAIALGYGGTGVAAVSVVAGVFALGLSAYTVSRIDPELALAPRTITSAQVRELLSFSGSGILINLGNYFRFYAGSLILARVASVGLVTPFGIAAKIMTQFQAVVFATVSPMMPALSALDGRAASAELAQLVLRGTRLSAVLSFLIATVLMLDGRAFLTLWLGEPGIQAHPVLQILTIGYAVYLAQAPASMLMFATGQHRALACWTLAEGILNLVVSVALAPPFGLLGVAVGTAAPMILTRLLVYPRYVVRPLAVSANRYLAGSFVRPLLVAVLAIGLGALVPFPTSASLTGLLTGFVVHGGIYCALAYCLSLTRDDRRLVRAVVTRPLAQIRAVQVSERVP